MTNDSPNPYQSPTSTPLPYKPGTLLYLVPDPRIAWRLRMPAGLLMLFSGVQLIPFLPLALNIFGEVTGRIWRGRFYWFPDEIRMGVAFCLVSIATLVIFAGGYQMLQLRNLQFCRAAAICACIPILSPGLVVGIPIGIWAAIVLYQPSTAAEFLRIKHPVLAEDLEDL